MKYYYSEDEQRLINLEDIIKNEYLPESIKETTKRAYEYIENTEKKGISAIDNIIKNFNSEEYLDTQNIIKEGVDTDKMVLFFFKITKYRRGSVYTAVQISFNHTIENDYMTDCYSNPYEKCNISFKIYCTDTILHSSNAFGTTPSIKECKNSINSINPEFLHTVIYKAFYYFCLT